MGISSTYRSRTIPKKLYSPRLLQHRWQLLKYPSQSPLQFWGSPAASHSRAGRSPPPADISSFYKPKEGLQRYKIQASAFADFVCALSPIHIPSSWGEHFNAKEAEYNSVLWVSLLQSFTIVQSLPCVLFFLLLLWMALILFPFQLVHCWNTNIKKGYGFPHWSCKPAPLLIHDKPITRVALNVKKQSISSTLWNETRKGGHVFNSCPK